MAALKELRRLRDEERTLVNIASKVSDQLNRLKVEELALVSMIRIGESQNQSVKLEGNHGNKDKTTDVQQQATATDADTSHVDRSEQDDTTLCQLDLSVSQHMENTEEFEEEEEADMT